MWRAMLGTRHPLRILNAGADLKYDVIVAGLDGMGSAAYQLVGRGIATGALITDYPASKPYERVRLSTAVRSRNSASDQ
jgi:hypothetical protein